MQQRAPGAVEVGGMKQFVCPAQIQGEGVRGTGFMGMLLNSVLMPDLNPGGPNSPQRNYSLEYLSVCQCEVCGPGIINAVISSQLLFHVSLPLPPPLTSGGLQ